MCGVFFKMCLLFLMGYFYIDGIVFNYGGSRVNMIEVVIIVDWFVEYR